MKRNLLIILSLMLLIGLFYGCFSNSEKQSITVEENKITDNQITEKIVSAIENAHSVEFETEGIISQKYAGKETTIENITYSQEVLGTRKTYNEIFSRENGEEYEIISYTEPNGEYIDVYFGVYGTWLKQSTDKKQLNELDMGSDGFLLFGEYIKRLEVTEILEEKRGDKDVFIITGEVASQGIEGIMDSFVSEEQLESLKSSHEVLKNVDVKSIYKNLKPIKMKLIVDSKTYLPIEISIDMKEMAESVYTNMARLVGNQTIARLFDVEEMRNDKKNISFDTFDDIEIPEEARNAEEYEIIE
ncbi:MAG: hypothetical protein IJO09_00285 [Oscillospiraceae bacterium]|nr:hypothetical protein [Oscillospiraceae bacterium]